LNHQPVLTPPELELDLLAPSPSQPAAGPDDSWPTGVRVQRATTPNVPAPAPEESLVVDARAGLSPSQMVEKKLIGLLRSGPLPVSQMMTRRAGR
jgi:hypothetical protein